MIHAARCRIAVQATASARHAHSILHDPRLDAIDATYKAQARDVLVAIKHERDVCLSTNKTHEKTEFQRATLSKLLKTLSAELIKIGEKWRETIRDPYFDYHNTPHLKGIAEDVLNHKRHLFDLSKVTIAIDTDLQKKFHVSGAGFVRQHSNKQEYLIGINPKDCLSADVFRFVIAHEFQHILQKHPFTPVNHWHSLFPLSSKMSLRKQYLALKRYFEREADISAAINPDGTVSAPMIKAASRLFFSELHGFDHDVYFKLYYQLHKDIAHPQKNIPEDFLWHPRSDQRQLYLLEMYKLKDTSNFINPKKLQDFIQNCHDYRCAKELLKKCFKNN